YPSNNKKEITPSDITKVLKSIELEDKIKDNNMYLEDQFEESN
ncbi:6165_t:CDS:2, partial [Racocetra persica]